MNRGFTLIELLVVVGIMGLMGTISVGGYRQMQQGMEQSTVVETVDRFLTLAKERALIDRKPTAVYCWNEMLKEETEDENAVYVGRAVAIRMKGRITRVDGDLLVDEFGDLEQHDIDGGFQKALDNEIPTRLYYFNALNEIKGGIKYTVVNDIPQTKTGSPDEEIQEFYPNMPDGRITKGGDTQEAVKGKNEKAGGKAENGGIVFFGYRKVPGGGGKADSLWKPGSAYGMEFQSLELPHGYLFESAVPQSMGTPAVDAKTVVYEPDRATSTEGVRISAYKPGQSGTLQLKNIGTAKPSQQQRN